MPGPVSPPATSKVAVAGGVGGASIAIYLIDRLLADDGQIAATMLTKLSPVLGPIWANYPIIALVVVVAWVIRDKWHASQAARALEVAASQAAAASLAASVGDVAPGLGGLRREVHELRGALEAHAGALEAHAEKTDGRLRDHELGLGELRGEVGRVSSRVDKLERPPAQPRPRARRPS